MLRYGSTGDAVETLQRALRASPVKATLAIDGDFGTLTRYWVGVFQHVIGLKRDEIVGARTWARLAPYITTTED